MSLKKTIAAALLLAGVSLTHAFAPQAGTWVVNSELNGAPGRGLAIDVQNNTLVMQMYAYESSGNATFYMTSGTMANDQYTGALMSYKGGRYLGSGPRSGSEAGNAGTVKFRFTSGITGFITLPGETEQAISRFNFGYGAVPSSLVGAWTLVSLGSEGMVGDAVQLTKNIGPSSGGNGLVTTADGLFGCEHQTSGAAAGLVMCVKITSGGTLTRGYVFAYSVNEGEGFSQRSGTGAEQQLQVRRFTTPSGNLTGIVYKTDEVGVDNPALRAHISDLAANYVPQQ
jgi:hypothetical protein